MLMGILTGPSTSDVRRQMVKGKPFVDGFEWRLDFFSQEALADLETLHKESGLPSLFTFRKGSLEPYLHLEPTYCDLEMGHPLIEDKYPKIRFIRSFHDFEKTPDDLQEILSTMRKTPAYGYKIAVKAKSTLDMLRLLCFVKETGSRITGVPMGILGQPGRIIGAALGNFFTFAMIENHPQLEEAGVLTVEELHERYRYRDLGPFTTFYALLGDPVEHSRSHITHNAVFAEKGWNKIYLKFLLKKEELCLFFEYAAQLPFRGFSVTMPLKESMVSHATHVEEAVDISSALNTLVFRQNNWYGANTDGKAAISLLEKHESLSGKKCIILGAGGTARAIAYEAVQRGARIALVNRTLEKAQKFTSRCGGDAYPLSALNQILEAGYDILVHATSVGFPGHEGCIIEEHHLLPRAIVLEVVSHNTPLQKMAEQKGCRFISGKDLFLAQAERQFALWNI